MRIQSLFILAMCQTIAAPLSAQREVRGNRILSGKLPRGALEVSEDFGYAGNQQFDLYGVANAEQHFFVQLEGTRIKHLLWIQFEGYHDSNTHTYTYRDSTIAHSGQTWHRRVSAARLPDTETRPESDGARARAFLKAKGWTLGPDVMLERLVWLLDQPPRNELMVIYAEDLSDQGLTAADLGEGGKAREKWSSLVEAFHRRALGAFVFRESRD